MPIIEVSKEDNRQLQNIANTLAAAKKIVVVTGAGISTNCGIPDFRSEEGLYSLIQARRDAASSSKSSDRLNTRTPLSTHVHSNTVVWTPPLPTNFKGKDLFDAQLWKNPTNTSVFYTFVSFLRKTIQEDVKRATATHRFIRTLRDRRKLIRCYTQNIDGLEAREGLNTDMTRGKGNRARFTRQVLGKPRAPANAMPGGDLDGGCEVVQLHGDLDVLRCTLCLQTCQWLDKYEARLLAGKAPICHFCTITNEDRQDRGKRTTKVGTLRPNIVLYGEEHPLADAVGTITAHDLALSPDVLLILGTSLHVHGLKILVKEFAKAVHARAGGMGKVLFVNFSKPSGSAWKDVIDYWVPMDCDEWVSTMRRHRPDIWQIQRELKPAVAKAPSKDVTKDSGISYISVKEEQEKENIKVVKNGIPDPKTFCPIVVVTPKKKRVIQDHASEFMSHSKQTPFNTGKTNSPLNSSQLPTPPSTSRRGRFQEAPAKRRRDREDEFMLPTPSKRRKPTIIIWDDAASRQQ